MINLYNSIISTIENLPIRLKSIDHEQILVNDDIHINDEKTKHILLKRTKSGSPYCSICNKAVGTCIHTRDGSDDESSDSDDDKSEDIERSNAIIAKKNHSVSSNVSSVSSSACSSRSSSSIESCEQADVSEVLFPNISGLTCMGCWGNETDLNMVKFNCKPQEIEGEISPQSPIPLPHVQVLILTSKI